MIIKSLKPILILLSLMVISFSANASTIDNLIENPSFEKGTITPSNWSFIERHGNIPTWDIDSHTGNRSVKIAFYGHYWKSGYLRSDLVNVEPSKDYNFSVWGKVNNIGGNLPSVKIVELDINEDWVTQNTLEFTKSDWIDKKISFKTNNRTVYVYVYANIGSGEFWIDDVSLTPVISTPIPTEPIPTPTETPVPIPTETPIPIPTETIPIPTETPIPTNIYYVSKNGDDMNPGTIGQPWLTISKAANTALAGDTVYIRNGSYFEKVYLKNSGSAGNYIIFAAYPGEIVNIDGSQISQSSYEGLINILGKSYIIIDGLYFKNALEQGAGIRIDAYATPSNNITIRNNSFISMFGGSPIKIGNDPTIDILIENNTIDRKISPTCGSMSDACWVEMISVSNSDRIILRYNHIKYNQIGNGIDFKDGTKNGKIYNNIIENNPTGGIYLDARGDMRNFEIYNNIVQSVDEAVTFANEDDSEYNGVALIENVSFYNNIVYNSKSGIRIGPYGSLIGKGTIGNVRIKNNLFYNNTYNDIGYYSKTYIKNLTLRNNIFNRNGLSVYNGSIDADHNMFDNSWNCYGSNCIIGDPMFIDPNKKDFHLNSTSPDIDNGSATDAPSFDLDGKVRPQGNAYDIGPYER